MRRVRTAAMVSLVLALAVCAQAPDLRPAIEQIDTMTAAELAKDSIAGVTVGVVSGGSLVWTKGYGLADAEKKRPATRETVYRIGSITKQFTGLMLLQLADQRKVRYSDPVERYFPEVNRVEGRVAGAPPITLLQLATMTAGIDREPADLNTYLKGPVAAWEKVLVAALPRTKYAFEPGTRYHYSNIGYAILGAALARAAGQPYVEYVEQRIFVPLGMTNTFFEPNARIRQHLARGYAVSGGKPAPETPQREHQGRGYKVPNGAMYSTVGDLARFAAFELGEGSPGVLSKATLDENFAQVHAANSSLTSGYGVGFQVIRRGDLIAVGHGGAVAGYQAACYVDRASRTGVIVLRNASGGAFQVSNLCLRALEKLAGVSRGQAR